LQDPSILESADHSGTTTRSQRYRLTLKIIFESPPAIAGFVIILAYSIISIIDFVDPNLIGVPNPYSMVPDFVNPVPSPPVWPLHPLGTTFPGIDLYQAIMAAIRIDLWYSLLIVLTGAAIGTIIGVSAAYIGGYFDEALMRFTDLFLSIPFLVFAIAVGFFLGREINDISLAIALVWWPLYARYARGQTLSIKENMFVEASRASGVGGWGIISKHIMPNVLTPIFVQISLDMGTIIQIFAALNFIGFASSNSLLPELGTLISDGFQYAVSAPWVVLYPGLALLIFAIGMNLFGDGLRDALDPRNRT